MLKYLWFVLVERYSQRDCTYIGARWQWLARWKAALWNVRFTDGKAYRIPF